MVKTCIFFNWSRGFHLIMKVSWEFRWNKMHPGTCSSLVCETPSSPFSDMYTWQSQRELFLRRELNEAYSLCDQYSYDPTLNCENYASVSEAFQTISVLKWPLSYFVFILMQTKVKQLSSGYLHPTSANLKLFWLRIHFLLLLFEEHCYFAVDAVFDCGLCEWGYVIWCSFDDHLFCLKKN